MRITSGTHVMFGELIMRAPAADVLGAWLAAQPAANEFATRDRAWWLDSIVDGHESELTLFEAGRTNHRAVERLSGLIGELAAAARSGEVTLQHHDNGVHVSEWRIVDGVVTATTSERQTPPAQRVPADVRRTFEDKKRALEARYAGLGVAEELRELIATSRDARAVCTRGGPPELRRRFAEAVSRAHGGLLSDFDGAARAYAYVADVTALSPEAQGALLDALRTDGNAPLYIAMPSDVQAAVASGRLRPDLYYRLSAQPGWPLDREVDATCDALARLA